RTGSYTTVLTTTFMGQWSKNCSQWPSGFWARAGGVTSMPKSARIGRSERVMGVLGSMEPILSAARPRSPQTIDASVEGALPHNSPPWPLEDQGAWTEGASARGGKGTKVRAFHLTPAPPRPLPPSRHHAPDPRDPGFRLLVSGHRGPAEPEITVERRQGLQKALTMRLHHAPAPPRV